MFTWNHDKAAQLFERLYERPVEYIDGTYYVDGTGEDATIHVYSSGYSTFAIVTFDSDMSAPSVEAVPEALGLTYDGTPQELVSAGTVVNGKIRYALGDADGTQPQASAYRETIPTAIAVGTYCVWYKGVSSVDLAESDARYVDVTIDPAPIESATVTLDTSQVVYDGGIHKVGVSAVSFGGRVLGTADYIVGGTTEATDSGDYRVNVTGTGNYCGTATAFWSILDVPLMATSNDVSVIYDGQPHGITVNVDGSADVTVTYGTVSGTYGLTASPEFTHVGSRVVYWKATAPNHEPLEGSSRVTVTARPVTVSGIRALDKPYDRTTNATLDCSNATIDNLVSGDDVAVRQIAVGTFTDAAMGEGKTVYVSNIELEGADVADYWLDDASSQHSATASITSNQPSVASSGYAGYYDGAPHTLTVTPGVAGVEVSYSSSQGVASEPPEFTEAGTYVVDWTASSRDGREVRGTLLVVINRMPVTVTGFETGDKPWDGTAEATIYPGSSMRITDIYGNDVGTLTATAKGTFDNAVAGTQTVTITDITLSGNTGNYVLDAVGSQHECTATINPVAPIFTAPTPLSLTYNGAKQELVDPGTATGGTMFYQLGGALSTGTYTTYYGYGTQAEEWSVSVPMATNAGTYSVHYKIEGDENHGNIDSQ